LLSKTTHFAEWSWNKFRNCKKKSYKTIKKYKDWASLDYPLSGKFSLGLNVEPPTLSFHVAKLENPNISASFLASFLVEQLEKRVPFRRAMKTALQRGERAGVKGTEIQVSGRLNGAEIARSEWLRKGQVPHFKLYGQIFNIVLKLQKLLWLSFGIKVWIFEGLSDS